MRLGLVLAACWIAHVSPAWAQCDPFSSEAPAPNPKPLAKTCGNSRIDEYNLQCVRVTSGGCGQPNTSAVRCDKGRESCDGRDLAGASCKDWDFAGGTLGCRRGCEGFDTSRCTLCAGPNCRELAIPGALAPIGDFTLIPRANVLRAFWVATVGDVSHEVSMTIGDDGKPADKPIDLGTLRTIDIVALSKVWVSVDDDGHDVVLKEITDTGKLQTVVTGVPSPAGNTYVMEVSGRDAALVIVGDIASNLFHVVMVDGTGKVVPLPDETIYARDRFERVVIAPVAPGPVKVNVGTNTLTATAQAGDRLFGWMHHNPQCAKGCAFGGAALLHAGARTQMQMSGEVDPPSLDIVAPAITIHFSPTGDQVGAKTFAPPPPPAAGPGPFGPFAKRTGIQRVATAHGHLVVASFQTNLEPTFHVAIAVEP